jgi:hypothetical protein
VKASKSFLNEAGAALPPRNSRKRYLDNIGSDLKIVAQNEDFNPRRES